MPTEQKTKPPPRRQCAKCPWKKGIDPNTIPNGYEVEKHKALKNTVARPGEVRLGGGLRVMACHESDVGRELPCVGWLDNQLNEGNNIGLRMAAFVDRTIDANVETVGPQHRRFDDTLPRAARAKRRR
jgi:hypothetical protein